MGMKSAYRVRTSGLANPTQVSVLEALAVFMNEGTGGCFPSTEKISVVARVSVKFVRKSLRELEEVGLISSVQKPGGRRFFTLHLDKLPPSTVFSEEGTNVTPDDNDRPRDNCRPRDICTGTPCQLSPTPRDNCPLDPVTIVTPIREEIRELNQETIGNFSPPLAPASDELELTPKVENPTEKEKPKAKKSRRMPQTPCPWEPGTPIPENLKEWAAENYPTIDASHEFEKFVGWMIAKDVRNAKWDQAFRNWMGNALKKAAQRGGNGGGRYPSNRPKPLSDMNYDTMAELFNQPDLYD